MANVNSKIISCIFVCTRLHLLWLLVKCVKDLKQFQFFIKLQNMGSNFCCISGKQENLPKRILTCTRAWSHLPQLPYLTRAGLQLWQLSSIKALILKNINNLLTLSANHLSYFLWLTSNTIWRQSFKGLQALGQNQCTAKWSFFL